MAIVDDSVLPENIATKRAEAIAWWGFPDEHLNDVGPDLGFEDGVLRQSYGWEIRSDEGGHKSIIVIVINYLPTLDLMLVTAQNNEGAVSEFNHQMNP